MFCFNFSWFLCFCFHLHKCLWHSGEAPGSRDTESGWALLHPFPLSSAWSQHLCKERNRKSISELPSLTKPLQQLRAGWGGWAEVGLWPKLCRAGEGWLLPCPVWSEPCWAHRAAWIPFMKQNPFWIYGMSVLLASMDFAWWEQQNISVIAGVPQLCTGPGAALHSGGGAALELCGL